MKRLLILIISIIIIFALALEIFSVSPKTIPSIKIKNLKGELIDTKDFSNDGKPFVINFWATWCKPCILEMNSINDVYDEWQKESGIKIIAISIDDSRNSKKVAPFVKGRGWKYEVYLDENGDFKRAMNVNNPPHTFICNAGGEVIWEHNGYAPGDEDELLKQYKNILIPQTE